MKVALCGRTDLFKYKGGDAVQMEQTALELNKLGIEVDIKTHWDFDYSQYDLIHIFQLDWIAENYLYAQKAQSAGKKIILSPIHHNVNEVKAYDDTFVFGFRRLQKLVLRNQFHRDTLKIFYRALKNPSKRLPAMYALTYGLKNLHTKTLQAASKVLVQTHAEATDLQQAYGVKVDYELVPNGVGEVFLTALHHKPEPVLPFSDYIVCVGRIEARKNQLSVISAVKALREQTAKDLQLVFVGQLSSTHTEYVGDFKAQLAEHAWLHHVDALAYTKMPAVYVYAQVAVSASWFETTGLTSLEALFCGTNAVASGDRARELLGDLVSYCTPSSVESIAKAIQTQLTATRPTLPEYFKQAFTWQTAAQKTAQVYEHCLQTE